MKIKTDFITNSSSSCYIVGVFPEDIPDFKRYIKKLEQHPERNDSVYITTILKSIRELKSYTNDEPLDWVSEAMAPKFINLQPRVYMECSECIEAGQNIVISWIDYNLEKEFAEKWNDNIMDRIY